MLIRKVKMKVTTTSQLRECLLQARYANLPKYTFIYMRASTLSILFYFHRFMKNTKATMLPVSVKINQSHHLR